MSQRLTVFFFVVAALACGSCKTTDPTARAGDDEDAIHVPDDDLTPMRRFVLDTRRLIVADLILINMSSQYFEAKMGLTRTYNYVDKKERKSKDGARVIILKNISDQATNIDPDLLPRVTFGQGLECRAYNELRIYLRRSVDKDNPLYIRIKAYTPDGDSKMWVTGRLEYEQPEINLRSELVWNDVRDRYVHSASLD